MNDGGTRIDGRSHLADDSPVIEARVFFGTAPVPMPDIATLTDEDGRFSLYAPAPGNYEIVCHADGLDPATTVINLDGTFSEIAVDIEMG